jgi:hypothetical protein
MHVRRFAGLAVAACTLGGSVAIPLLVIGSGTPAAAVSFNPGPANRFHAPVSAMGISAINNGAAHAADAPNAGQPISGAVHAAAAPAASGVSSIPLPSDIIRFNTDTSYITQSETTVAVDPADTNHVVGGVNDARMFVCPILPADCTSGYTNSLSGFTTSADGGHSVTFSDDIPGLTIGSATKATFLASWGDPNVAATVDGNFYFSSLAINPASQTNGNGIELAVSNGKLWSNPTSCTTPLSDSTANPCWSSQFVFGDTGNGTVATFEDKDMLAVDRDPSSKFYGDAYVGWDHFFADGTSSSYVARCTESLKCTMLSGGPKKIISGGDQFVAFTTPVVDSHGNVYVTWCNFGTATTLTPIVCKETSSGPGGTSFGAPVTILSTNGGLNGYATEQFRTANIPVLAVDNSPTATNGNLYFTIDACTKGNYYDVTAPNTPGDCGASAVLFSSSTDGGATWSTPVDVSAAAPSPHAIAPADAVTVQPWVTVDGATGEVDLAYYTSQFDPFDHRLDVEVAGSRDAGHSWSFSRLTPASIEPDSDPNYYDYTVPNGFGGGFIVPQFGDYFQAVALNGTLWTSFNATYTAEEGTFQTDPYLAVTHEP